MGKFTAIFFLASRTPSDGKRNGRPWITTQRKAMRYGGTDGA
jgi:hypothetical protein